MLGLARQTGASDYESVGCEFPGLLRASLSPGPSRTRTGWRAPSRTRQGVPYPYGIP